MGVQTSVENGTAEEQVDLLRRRVLNVVGHELRTPVTTLAGLAEELSSCEDEGRRRELTEALVRATERLDRLVHDLLLAADVSTLVPVGDAERVAMRSLVDELAPSSADVQGDGSATARPAAVRLALEALFDNATVHGEPPVGVTIAESDGRVVVEVASGGPETQAADVELACEAFYRGERAVTSAAGLGLGLSVARTLARADGGEVTVRAGTAGGMVARLELPAA